MVLSHHPCSGAAGLRGATLGEFRYVCWRLILRSAGAECHRHHNDLYNDDELDHLDHLVHSDSSGSRRPDDGGVYDEHEYDDGDGWNWAVSHYGRCY